MTEQALPVTFLPRFVLPLLQGGEVHVGAPLAPRLTKALTNDVASALDATAEGQLLSQLRHQHLLRLHPLVSPPLLADDTGALMMLVALHDLLFLLHPEASRLSRVQHRQLVRWTELRALRAAAQLPVASVSTIESPQGPSAVTPQSEEHPSSAQLQDLLLGRHSLLGCLPQLTRRDLRVTTWLGEHTYRGMVPRAGLFGGRQRRRPAQESSKDQEQLTEVALWAELQGLSPPDGGLVLPALLKASPLTALLLTLPAHGPLTLTAGLQDALVDCLSEHARWLRLERVARLFMQRLLVGGVDAAVALMGAALVALLRRQAEKRLAVGGAELGTLLCLHSHLHLCMALRQRASDRIRPASAPEPAGDVDAAALYVVVRAGWPQLSAPGDVVADPALLAVLDGYVQRCRARVSLQYLQELHQLCTGALNSSTPSMPRPPYTYSPALPSR